MKLESIKIVLPGSWNPAIFSPEWMMKECSGCFQSNSKAEQGFNPLDYTTMLKIEDIVIFPTQSMLTISDQAPKVQALYRVQKVCLKIMEKLPHTPIGAIGINFEYNFNHIPDKIAAILESLGEANVEISEFKERYAMDGYTLNIVHKKPLLAESAGFKILFNHHFGLNQFDKFQAVSFEELYSNINVRLGVYNGA